MGTPDVPILAATGLGKTYRMGEVDVPALHDVTLSVRSGEILVLLGQSGSGKSTLLNILGGLDTPTTGQMCFGDEDLTQGDEKRLTAYRRRHVGFVFQFYNLIPSLTARENVALAAEIAEDPLDPAEALTLVGLADRMDHFPSQMSGGQQQRVAIARAIVKRPNLLLCDEPTGALDSATGIIVLEALEQFNRKFGATVVLITHNAAIARMADRFITLSDGCITEEQRNDHRTDPKEIAW